MTIAKPSGRSSTKLGKKKSLHFLSRCYTTFEELGYSILHQTLFVKQEKDDIVPDGQRKGRVILKSS